jgi:hypothetical protein
MATTLQAPPEHSLVFLAHNGPAGTDLFFSFVFLFQATQQQAHICRGKASKLNL